MIKKNDHVLYLYFVYFLQMMLSKEIEKVR